MKAILIRSKKKKLSCNLLHPKVKNNHRFDSKHFYLIACLCMSYKYNGLQYNKNGFSELGAIKSK